MLKKKIPSEILKDSPTAYFYTHDQYNRLFISNIHGKTYINNNINIINKDLLFNNGIIHIIDSIIWPYII